MTPKLQKDISAIIFFFIFSLVWFLYQLIDSDPSFFAPFLRICDKIQGYFQGSTDKQRYYCNLGLFMEKVRLGLTR